jgi:hypothetical protein
MRFGDSDNVRPTGWPWTGLQGREADSYWWDWYGDCHAVCDVVMLMWVDDVYANRSGMYG